MLSVVRLNFVILSVVRLNVIMLSVIRLNVVMLSVVSPLSDGLLLFVVTPRVFAIKLSTPGAG
jgi:hypothetical protein